MQWSPHTSRTSARRTASPRGRNGSGTIFFSGCNLRCVFCLPPGSLVATHRGPQAIEGIFDTAAIEFNVNGGSVRLAEDLRVFTQTGDEASVSKVFRHPYEGELVRLKPLCAPELHLTPNHEVFATRRSRPSRLVKVPAGELTHEHYLVVPKRIPRPQPPTLDVAAVLGQHVSALVRQRERRVDEPELVSALTAKRTSRELARDLGYHPTYVRRLRAQLRRGELATDPPRARSIQREDEHVRFDGEHRPGIPAVLALDEKLAWLLGLYCAEGHVTHSAGRPNSYRLAFSTGHHERPLARRAIRDLNSTFAVRSTLVQRRTTNTVEVGKTSVALLFSLLGGTGAATKRVPAPIFGAPESVVRAFLEGYLAGDGTDTETHRVANTVSRDLAHGLYDVGLRLGVLPSIHRWMPPRRKVIEGRTVRQSPLWYVKFKRDRLNGSVRANERTRWKDEGSHFLVPIHRIEREPYEGFVYNLEVDHPTHSYLAPAVAVANCQNNDISWRVNGEAAPPERLAGMMLELQRIGCHNINWVTPEHVVPQILEALPLAVEGGLRLPIVYNTSAYDSPESLALMDGIVDIYMPDVKMWSQERARRYLAKRDYAEVASESVKEMHRQVGDLVLDERGMARRGLIVRHLLMPGQLEETEAILRFVAAELGPGTYVNLMAQYYPAGKVGKDGRFDEIDRGVSGGEYERALSIAAELGLERLDSRSRAQGQSLAAA